jgi:hypothetical protein
MSVAPAFIREGTASGVDNPWRPAIVMVTAVSAKRARILKSGIARIARQLEEPIRLLTANANGVEKRLRHQLCNLIV